MVTCFIGRCSLRAVEVGSAIPWVPLDVKAWRYREVAGMMQRFGLIAHFYPAVEFSVMSASRAQLTLRRQAFAFGMFAKGRVTAQTFWCRLGVQTPFNSCLFQMLLAFRVALLSHSLF